jgi:hypothetical protein
MLSSLSSLIFVVMFVTELVLPGAAPAELKTVGLPSRRQTGEPNESSAQSVPRYNWIDIGDVVRSTGHPAAESQLSSARHGKRNSLKLPELLEKKSAPISCNIVCNCHSNSHNNNGHTAARETIPPHLLWKFMERYLERYRRVNHVTSRQLSSETQYISRRQHLSSRPQLGDVDDLRLSPRLVAGSTHRSTGPNVVRKSVAGMVHGCHCNCGNTGSNNVNNIGTNNGNSNSNNNADSNNNIGANNNRRCCRSRLTGKHCGRTCLRAEHKVL